MPSVLRTSIRDLAADEESQVYLSLLHLPYYFILIISLAADRNIESGEYN